MVDQAKAITVERTKSEVRILLQSSPVAELAGGHRVLLRVDDPQFPSGPVKQKNIGNKRGKKKAGPVLSLLTVFYCPHLQASQEYLNSASLKKTCTLSLNNHTTPVLMKGKLEVVFILAGRFGGQLTSGGGTLAPPGESRL